jgi:hypothetical protein
MVEEIDFDVVLGFDLWFYVTGKAQGERTRGLEFPRRQNLLTGPIFLYRRRKYPQYYPFITKGIKRSCPGCRAGGGPVF